MNNDQIVTRNVALNLALLILLTIISVGCTMHHLDPHESNLKYAAELRERLSKVDVFNGIDKDEALAISDNYYHRFTFSGCGAPGALEETPDAWLRVVHIGYAATAIPERIRVDKKTGQVSWKFGPTINDPQEIWSY